MNPSSSLRMAGRAWLAGGLLLMVSARGAFRELFFHSDSPGCSLNTLSCWSTESRAVTPPATLPDNETRCFFRGVDALQEAGNTHVWQGLVVEPADLFGSILQRTFTQNGTLTVTEAYLNDGCKHLLAQGTFTAQTLKTGSPILTIRQQADPAVFEQLAGVATVQTVTLGNSYSPPGGLGGVRYHYPATMWLKGGRFNATEIKTGLDAGSTVDRIIKLDGGFLSATTVAGISDVVVGSVAPRQGALDLGQGQIMSCTRLSAGLLGGRGTILISGTGARLTASEVLFASGPGSRATVVIGLSAEGVLATGLLRMGVESNSTATVQVQGALARVEVNGDLDAGLGGSAQITAQDGAKVTADRIRLGLGTPGSPAAKLILASNGTLVDTPDLTVGAGSAAELVIHPGALCASDQLQVGSGGLVHLKRGQIEAVQANFRSGSTLRFDIGGNVPGTGYSQMLRLTSLAFAGRLELNVVDGYVPSPGQHFQLFGFSAFSGSFDPSAITVTGFDKNALDFSRLPVDGTVWVGPAPGPFRVSLTPAAVSSSYDVAWASRPGKLYDLVTSTNLFLPFSAWTVHETHRNLRATLTTTGIAALPVTGNHGFFALVEKEMPVPVIANPSFEADSFSVWPGYLAGNGGITGWTWTGLAAGLNPAAGTPFADNGAVPHGVNVAFLQSSGDAVQMLSTTITGLVPGFTYDVRFRANSRAATAPPSASWSLNGGAFAAFSVSPAVGGSNGYYEVTDSFTASAGTAVLVLRNQTAADSALLVDDFRISAR